MRGGSADDGQTAVGYIVLDEMSETDDLTIIDSCDINAATLELVDECLVVIGTHSGPAGIADLTIEYCY